MKRINLSKIRNTDRFVKPLRNPGALDLNKFVELVNRSCIDKAYIRPTIDLNRELLVRVTLDQIRHPDRLKRHAANFLDYANTRKSFGDLELVLIKELVTILDPDDALTGKIVTAVLEKVPEVDRVQTLYSYYLSFYPDPNKISYIITARVDALTEIMSVGKIFSLDNN